MDFAKFIWLLDSHSLFFTRADKLGDPFEGSWPKMNVLAREPFLDGILDEHRESIAKMAKTMQQLTKNWPRYTAVNCWHMNEHESAAMWKLYLKSDEGIAVQSTYARLKQSLIDEEAIFLGIVKYIDYETDSIEPDNLLAPFLHKRKSYEHEREVRAFVVKWPVSDQEKGMDFNKDTINDGLAIKIDIATLVERIYVAPTAPDWFADLVKNAVIRFGCTFEVEHSRLSEKPLF
jgi:hypothetical protein